MYIHNNRFTRKLHHPMFIRCVSVTRRHILPPTSTSTNPFKYLEGHTKRPSLFPLASLKLGQIIAFASSNLLILLAIRFSHKHIHTHSIHCNYYVSTSIEIDWPQISRTNKYIFVHKYSIYEAIHLPHFRGVMLMSPLPRIQGQWVNNMYRDKSPSSYSTAFFSPSPTPGQSIHCVTLGHFVYGRRLLQLNFKPILKLLFGETQNRFTRQSPLATY